MPRGHSVDLIETLLVSYTPSYTIDTPYLPYCDCRERLFLATCYTRLLAHVFYLLNKKVLAHALLIDDSLVNKLLV